MNNKIIFNGVFGSHLYGTATPESDKDYKAIFLPTFDELIMSEGKNHFSTNTSDHTSKNTSDDIDIEYYSLKYFIEMAKKGETITIDMLHTPVHLNSAGSNPVWDYIQQNRSRFYTTDMKAYIGYVRKQAAKYGVKGSRLAALKQVIDLTKDMKEVENVPIRVKYRDGDVIIPQHRYDYTILHIKDIISELPINEFCDITICPKTGNRFYQILGRKYQDTVSIAHFKSYLNGIWDEYGERARKAEANEGIDWKSLHHACRGGEQLVEIFTTGDLKYPLNSADFLKQVKLGKIPFKIVQEHLEWISDEVEKQSKIASKNGMRQQVDTKFWDDFIYDVNLQTIKEGILK